MAFVRFSGLISLTVVLLLAGSSFMVGNSLQAGPLKWCQKSLAQFRSSSISDKIKRVSDQLKIQISRNQDEAFSEFKTQTLKPKPWLYARTALESSALFWASVYGLSALHSLGLQVFGGNANGSGISRLIVEDPEFMIFVMGVFAPLTEEFVFRFGPRLFFGKTWKVGVLASLAFGFAHNIHQIPLPQIVGGFYFWYLMKNRGLVYSMAAHSIVGAWVVFSTLYL